MATETQTYDEKFMKVARIALSHADAGPLINWMEWREDEIFAARVKQSDQLRELERANRATAHALSNTAKWKLVAFAGWLIAGLVMFTPKAHAAEPQATISIKPALALPCFTDPISIDHGCDISYTLRIDIARSDALTVGTIYLITGTDTQGRKITIKGFMDRRNKMAILMFGPYPIVTFDYHLSFVTTTAEMIGSVAQ